MPGSLTILRAHNGRRLAKLYEVSAGGPVTVRQWDSVALFSAESAAVDGIRGLHRLLRRIEGDPGACVIRGEAAPETDRKRTRRNKAAFPETPRDWLMLDADGIALPAGCSVLAEPAEAARVLLDILAAHAPELEGVSAVVQFSSSAGLHELGEAAEAAGLPNIWRGVAKPGLSAHVWYCLRRPIGEVELKRWAGAINAEAGCKVVDPATLQTVQVHYTAAPIFEAPLRDPLAGRRTLLIEGEEEAADLRIPAAAERPRSAAGAGGLAGAGRGYAAFLAEIGGPEGFRGPILQAVASFVGANWPFADLEALKADIRARIDAADPGGRPAAVLREYASDRHLDSLIAWATAREEEKHAARAAEAAAAAAEPIPPTYPDDGVTLAEAKRRTLFVLEDFARRITAGETPQLLLRKTVGSGKTFDAIDFLPPLLIAGRLAQRGPVLFLHPRHALGDQIAADIRRRHPGLRVAVYRGMDAEDPARPGKSMCQDRELTRAAMAAGQSATAACAACPLAEGCAYRGQGAAGRNADVWLAPHAVLFMQPFAGWPRREEDGKRVPVPPSAVIIDEDMTGAGLRGDNPLNPMQLALSALASTETPNLTGWDRERLLDLRRQALDSLTDQPAGGLFREPVAWMEEDAAREWAALEWDCKPRVKLGKGTTRAEAMAAFGDAAAQGFTRLRPVLADRIGAFLATGDVRSVNLTIKPEAELGRGQGTGPAVQFAWRDDIHAAWAAPLLFLDATGRPEVLRHWAPALRVVDIEVRAPHQHVVQVADREFGRTWATTEGNAGRLADLVMVETARAAGPVLVVAQMAVERLLRAEIERRGGACDPVLGNSQDDPSTYRFPSGAVLHLAHHGAVTGSNAWEAVATVLVIGRPATNRLEGERKAEVIGGRAVEAAGIEGTWWPTVPAALRMADGTGRRIEKQPRHPDPLVEADRWAVTEGAVLQAIGRARGVRRTGANPVRVVVLAALALPLTVAEAPTWEEMQPGDMAVAVAEAALCGRALPLAPADMVKARPDRWRSETRAKEGLAGFERAVSLIGGTYKENGPFKIRGLSLARYRLGLRGRWSAALVPPEDGRAALEAILGPLAAFEPIPPPAAEPETSGEESGHGPERVDSGRPGGAAAGGATRPSGGGDGDLHPDWPGGRMDRGGDRGEPPRPPPRCVGSGWASGGGAHAG